MAKHMRQMIREAVVARLLGATAAQDRVYASRLGPWATLPGIGVYTLGETIDQGRTLEGGGRRPAVLGRTLRLAISGFVAVTDYLDEQLDALALEIEDLMVEPLGLDAILDVRLVETTIEMYEESDRQVGGVRLAFEVTYFTQ